MVVEEGERDRVNLDSPASKIVPRFILKEKN